MLSIIDEKLKNLQIETDHDISLKNSEIITQLDARMDTEKLTVVRELHKQVRKNYPRRRVQMRGIDETWQADFVEMIPYLYNEYNDSEHRTIGMKPKDVTATDEEVLLQRFHKAKKMIPRRPKFKIGDKV